MKKSVKVLTLILLFNSAMALTLVVKDRVGQLNGRRVSKDIARPAEIQAKPLPPLYPETLRIPDASINVKVNQAKVNGNDWDLYYNAASYLTTSAHLNEEGNTVIYGHNTQNLLGRLKQVDPGTRILIDTKENTLTYVVREKMVVKPEQVEIVNPTDDKRLTLFTCTNFMDTDRLVIIASPVKTFGEIIEN